MTATEDHMFNLLIALFASGLLAPQQRSDPTVFPAKAQMVFVDFVVTDNTHKILGGLKAQNFLVKEDGHERPILAFSAIDTDIDAINADRGPAELPSPPPEQNTLALASAPAVAVLVVDDQHLTKGQAVRLQPALKSLIAELAHRNGGLALMAPMSGIQVARPLPQGIDDLSDAAGRIRGFRTVDASDKFPISDSEAIAAVRGNNAVRRQLFIRFQELNPVLEDDIEGLVMARAAEVAFAARARRTNLFTVIQKALDWLGGQPGRHSVVMVSGGFTLEEGDPALREILTRSFRANAPIHFLDARGLRGMPRYQGVEYGPLLENNAGESAFEWDDDAGGSSNLAADTGGIVIRNRNDLRSGLTLLLDTMKTFYVLGYEPIPRGKAVFRKIRVESRMKGTKVIARRGYYERPASP